MRLKIEINTREHFCVLCARAVPHSVSSPWFSGGAPVATYPIKEILGTKLRALYQRKKGRDLFDLWLALDYLSLEESAVVACFERYMEHAGTKVSRAEFERNLEAKLLDPAFVGDVSPLLAAPEAYDAALASRVVLERLVARLPGEPWRRADAAT
jgi:predicted nucleotidyltransferase component of viral defense system